MLKRSVSDMFEKILGDIGKYSMDNIIVKIERDDNVGGSVSLVTDIYKLEVIIKAKWVGYDFDLDKSLTQGIPVGSALDTDLYALDYNAEVTEEIFMNIQQFINALLSGELYYGMIDGEAVFARPEEQDEYRATFYPKRCFL